MSNQLLKQKITEAVIKELPFHVEFEDALRDWWFTGINSNVLRLNDKGDTHFRIAQIEFYQYDFSS